VKFQKNQVILYKKRKRLVQPRQALEGRPVKSFFDFIGRTEIESIADCPETQKLETPTKKRFLLLPAELKFRSF
jgi:hypothetical protein